MSQFEMLEGNKAKLTINVSAEEFEKALQEAYRKTGSRYTVQGFRKGKTPRKVIENYYGAGVFYEEAFDAVWGNAYDAAIDEHNLIPVDQLPYYSELSCCFFLTPYLRIYVAYADHDMPSMIVFYHRSLHAHICRNVAEHQPVPDVA